MEKDPVNQPCEMLLIGGSAGSLEVLFRLLPLLRPGLGLAIVIVLHRRSSGDSSLTELLGSKSVYPTREVEDKDFIAPGNIFLAPADYHLLIEKNHSFALDYSEKINYSRPSIDVTFESAAEIYGSSLAALLLSGANEDGTSGLLAIKRSGGITAAQDPSTASMPFMPQHAITHKAADHVFDIRQAADFINNLV